MRTRALIRRICQQMIRDKRTLALLFVVPLFILTLMYFLFNSNEVNLKLGIVNGNKDLIKILEDGGMDVKEYTEAQDKATSDIIIGDDLDGLLVIDGQKLELTLQNTDPNISKALQIKITQAIASQTMATFLRAVQSSIQGNPNIKIPEIGIKYVYGNAETNYFDVLSPVLVGFFVFFFVFLIAGIGLLRERTTGTLERLMSTPIRRGEVITGYLAGYGIFAVVQTIIVVVYSINILDISIAGSLWNVLMVNLLLAFTALSLGILLSTFAASEFQMMQFIPVVIIPQAFFCGLFPLEGMAGWLQTLGRFMPIYYGADALKGVMYKGWGFGKIYGDIAVLTLFATVFVVLNVFALKKYRTI